MAKPALIIISWDGKSEPAGLLQRDAAPDFDLILFDYSGKAERVSDGTPLMSHATECKGQIFAHVGAWLAAQSDGYDWIGIIDDDIEITVSRLNACLAAAAAHGLSSCSPALTADSAYSHRWTLQQQGGGIRRVNFVEVMMPIYATALFRAATPLFRHSISSYGIDQFVFPMLQKVIGAGDAAMIDAVSARHGRSITSNRRVYSNGLTAAQERIRLRRLCIDWLRDHHPELIGTRWFLDTFAPWNGPARFWLTRLKFW